MKIHILYNAKYYKYHNTYKIIYYMTILWKLYTKRGRDSQTATARN